MAEEPLTNNESEEVEESVVRNDKPRRFRDSAGDERSEERPREERPRERREQQRRPRYRRQDDDESTGGGYSRSGRFQPRRKVCVFCADKVKSIDWKNIDTLRRFMNSNGSIRPRRKTGTCAKHQRQLAVAIKRARHLALTPFTDDHVRLYGGRR
ncbi:MAG: 30S ribosomal protein S18 [Anaerolineae bacterium]|nr:30S ribosomal protein S18 [Anaerolineae bacterium]